MEIAADVLKRAQTNLNTIVGPIKYNAQNYCETPVVGGQWTKGKDGAWVLQIVNNKLYPNIPVTAEMIFPLPK